jgi:hypothetical protein
MWGCMDTCSRSVSPLSFSQSTKLQQPLQSSAPKKKVEKIWGHGTCFATAVYTLQFSDFDPTLLPSLGEVGEFHEPLHWVWQWVKHESMNSPHSLLPSAAFNSWMSFLLNPAKHGQRRKHLCSHRKQDGHHRFESRKHINRMSIGVLISIHAICNSYFLLFVSHRDLQ